MYDKPSLTSSSELSSDSSSELPLDVSFFFGGAEPPFLAPANAGVILALGS